MKVGFIGAGGTGKTTTLELLGDLGYERVTSVTRSVYERHKLTEEAMSQRSPEFRWQIQKEMFDARYWLELEIENHRFLPVGDKPYNVITDRTILDHASYCFFYSASVIDDLMAIEMELKSRQIMETYDKLFYFPLGFFKPPNDGLRKQPYAYRATIDSIMRGFLRRLALGQYVVPNGSAEMRAQWVRQRILNKEI